VINLNEGRISVEDSEVSTEGLSGPDEILARYLALVYHLRNMPLGTAAHLRVLDLEVLSTALEIETTDIKKRLKRLMSDEDAITAQRQRIDRRVLLPLVGVVLAACLDGVLVLVSDSESTPEPIATSTQIETDVSVPALATPAIAADIGNGGAVAGAASVEPRRVSAGVEINPEG
jgi:hypothetical protein